ncbi:PAS domain S-box-containing protein [Cyclobacterium lianum]|uniref:histidine kinase n=1 Tax=Cyclobacterium lianum TaxID=388280 RepID=A0A1M7LI17_9BACT|nr:PAS domain S-box protein [Cyclobacterium lianum]SHM77692.1 PAS domain S-box-containing protein [Cyclobacterium lianum]
MEDHKSFVSLEALQSYSILDSLPEKEYDDIVGIASYICQTPISLITFLASDKQFFKARQGLDLKETPIDQSFCRYAAKSGREIFIVPDAREDQRFKDNPLVKNDPHIVFYAGVPLYAANGQALGALCVIDRKPRVLDDKQVTSLKALADQVIKLLELRKNHLELDKTRTIMQEEKNRLDNIIEATRVGTFEWNVQTDEVRINSRWAEIVGYTLEELEPVTMDTWYRLVHPEDIAHSDAALKDCFDRKTDFYDIELRMIHKAGHEVWINDRGRVVKWSEEGAPLLMSGTHTDITDRKNTEIQFKTISDNIPGVVYRYKRYPDGRDELQLVSNGAKHLWGIAPEQAMKNNQLVWDRYEREDLDAHLETIRKSAQEQSFWTHEWRYHHPDGGVHWHRGTGTPRQMEDGSTIWDAVIFDITTEKMAALKLNLTMDSLQERIKEQKCLYQISRLSNQVDDIEQLLTDAIKLLPLGWARPEHTSAEIEFDGKSYLSSDFKPTDFFLEQKFRTRSGKSLRITVMTSPFPQSGNRKEPFLPEERELLETITQNLAIAIDQKEISRELKNTNRKIEDLVQSIDGIVWEAEVDSLKFSFISQQVENILGYTPGEWMGVADFWQNHIHPDDKKEALDYCENQTRMGYDHSFEYRMIAADGREVWLHDLVKVVRENGKPVALRGLMVDITPRKLAEQKLMLSEKRFKSLVQNGSDLIAILDPEGNYIYVNTNSTQILGISPEEFIGNNAFSFIHPEDREKVFEEFSKIQNSGKIAIPPFRFKHSDGSWRMIETVATNLIDDPSIQGIVANSRDVTEKIASDQKLALSEKRFKALVQEGSDLTAVVDLEGSCLYASPSFALIAGYIEEELLGENLGDFIHPDDLEEVHRNFSNVRDRKRVKISPFRFRIKGGGWCWLQSVATNLTDDEAIKGVVLNSADITGLIETQEKLMNSEARYRGFYESQTNFVIRTDLEGNYTYVNKKFIQEFGWIYPDGNILGKSCMSSICEHDQQGVLTVVEQCIAQPEKVFKVEIDKPARGGGFVTTLWDFICVVDAHGQPKEIQCMGIDISRRIKIERELRKHNERYEYVNLATNDAIYDWDVINDQFEWGDGFYRMFGYERGGGITKLADWPALKHPSELEADQKKWDAFMDDKTVFRWHEESRLRKADGTYLDIEEIGHLIRDDAGKPIRMIGVLRDITESKREKNQKMIQGELAHLFKQDRSLEAILRDALQYLADFEGYLAAEIWLAGSDQSALNLSCTFFKDKKRKQFYAKNKAVSNLKSGEGLPGKVWQTGQGEVWEGLGKLDSFVRKSSSAAAGLEFALGLPLLYKDQPIGVLVFLSDQEISTQMQDFFLPVATFLGGEIRRKQQEEEMSLMFQSAPEILAIASPKGYFVKVNPAFCEIIGYEESEIVGQPFIDFLHPEDLDKTSKEFTETVSGKRQAKNYINRYRTRSGEFRCISWNSSKPFGDEGMVFAYGYDITEMKELQSLHNNATQLARVGSWEINVPAQVLYLSDITKEIYGIGNELTLDIPEAIGFYREDVREYVKQTIEKAIERGEGWDFELPLINAFGKEIWVRSIGQTEFIAGECVRLYGSLQDIHDRKMLEQELAGRNELLSAISKVIGTFLQEEDWYTALEGVFEITGTVAQVDRVYYFENHQDPQSGVEVCSQRFEWTNGHTSPQIDNPDLQNLPLAHFPEFFEPLRQGKASQIITSSLPEKSALKPVLAEQGIKSCLVLPIEIDKALFGFIGFDDCNSERKWSQSETSFLQNISSNLSAAIQRRRNQLSLQKAFEERNAILESIGEAFFSVDKNWKVQYWNKNAEKLTGVLKEHILGESLWENFPMAKDSKFFGAYDTAVRNQEPVLFEEYYRPLKLWLEVSANPTEEGISVFFRDVTDRKSAAEQIRQSNERFEKISEATNDAIWDFDVAENHLMWGRGFSTLFGYDLEKFKPDFDLLLSLIHPEDRDRVSQKIREYMESSTLTNWFEEYRFMMADGYYAFVMDRAVFIRDNEGRVTRVVGAMTDISYRKEYEESLQALNEQLEQHARDLEISNKELEQFAYVASHDLQEPLRMVSSFIGLLDKKYGQLLDEKGHQYIGFALGGAKRMRQIILDLLEYSRVGKTDEGLKIIQLDEILDEVCLLHKKAIAEKRAKVVYDRLPALITYKSPMMQLFGNLIGNALRYSKEDGSPVIHITASAEGDQWLFAVADNGIGIDPQFHEKIFIIFQSLHSKEKYGGTGMGLAIVKKIVENLGGKIWVESEEGVGSTFYFSLPKVEEEHGGKA